MADVIDRANDRADAEREAALQRHRNRKRGTGWVTPLSDLATPVAGADLDQRRAMLVEAGNCINCGEPIGNARREAMPEAVRCVDCEHDHEAAKK